MNVISSGKGAGSEESKGLPVMEPHDRRPPEHEGYDAENRRRKKEQRQGVAHDPAPGSASL